MVEIVDPAEKTPLTPPDRPWKPGAHPEYKCFRLRVLVAETAENVFSDHEPESEEDREALQKFQSGGLRQASYALFTEALRKEAMYTVLLKLTNDPEFERRLSQATPDQQVQIEQEIGMVLAQTLVGEIRKNATACAREAIEHIRLTAGAKPV